MDRDTAHRHATLLTKAGIPTVAAPLRASGPGNAIWGVRAGFNGPAPVYTHIDRLPPQWRHVLDNACINCGTTAGTAAMFNTATGEHDMWCAICFYGDAA